MEGKELSIEQEWAAIKNLHLPTFKQMRSILYRIHVLKINLSGLVLEIGVKMLISYTSEMLKVENHPLLVDVFYAALQCKCFDWGKAILEIFMREYPDMPKILRMRAMYSDATGEQELGYKILGAILKEVPEDQFTLKRLAASFRHVNDLDKALSVLNKYIEVYQNDLEAWMEMADIYMSRFQFDKARFCYEELVVSQPQNYYYITKYAEILYSEGGPPNLNLARKYLSHAVLLNNTNSRVFWMLLQTCLSIRDQGKSSSDQENISMIKA